MMLEKKPKANEPTGNSSEDKGNSISVSDYDEERVKGQIVGARASRNDQKKVNNKKSQQAGARAEGVKATEGEERGPRKKDSMGSQANDTSNGHPPGKPKDGTDDKSPWYVQRLNSKKKQIMEYLEESTEYGIS